MLLCSAGVLLRLPLVLERSLQELSPHALHKMHHLRWGGQSMLCQRVGSGQGRLQSGPAVCATHAALRHNALPSASRPCNMRPLQPVPLAAQGRSAARPCGPRRCILAHTGRSHARPGPRAPLPPSPPRPTSSTQCRIASQGMSILCGSGWLVSGELLLPSRYSQSWYSRVGG